MLVPIAAPTDRVEPVDGIAGLAVDLMDKLGGAGAALLVGLDNVFPPVPSEPRCSSAEWCRCSAAWSRCPQAWNACRCGCFSRSPPWGSSIWNAVFVVAGYSLGENWRLVDQYAGLFQKIVIGLVALATAVFVVVRIRGRHPTNAESRYSR